MASDLENKHFIENTVRPFFREELPVILDGLAELFDRVKKAESAIKQLSKQGQSKKNN